MKIFLIIVAVLFIVLFVTGCDVNSKYDPSDHYCEMWKIWHDTNGEYGWPDKNDLYDDECK